MPSIVRSMSVRNQTVRTLTHIKPKEEIPLEDYLKLCEQLGIQRNEPGTVEFVAVPGPRVDE